MQGKQGDSSVPWEIPAPGDFTPQTLAAFIARIVSADRGLWFQGQWFGIPGNYGGRMEASLFLDALRNGRHSCGTTGCVAGWAAVLTAPDAVVKPGGLFTPGRAGLVDAWSLGAQALALNDRQADYLFSAIRSRREVLAALDAIAETGTFTVPDNEDDDEGEDDEDTIEGQ